MKRLRALMWLVAMVAFVVPAFGTTMAGHAMTADHMAAMTQGETAASADCPDHAPPPECPAQGTASHAAGLCCPMMSGAFVVLPPTDVAGALPRYLPVEAADARHLTGLDLTRDPPPPRV